MITQARADLKAHLRRILEERRGPAMAVTGAELARMFGFKDDRIIRLAIRELIKGDGDGNNGLPVASETNVRKDIDGNIIARPGYYIPLSRPQGEEYAAAIRSRLIEDALRRRDFRRAADQYFTPAEQQTFQFGADGQGRLI